MCSRRQLLTNCFCNLQVKKGEFAKRKKPEATMKDLLTMGVFNAVGVAIRSSTEEEVWSRRVVVSKP